MCIKYCNICYIEKDAQISNYIVCIFVRFIEVVGLRPITYTEVRQFCKNPSASKPPPPQKKKNGLCLLKKRRLLNGLWLLKKKKAMIFK